MKNPTMLYCHPGKHKIHGDLFDYTIVGEESVEDALKDGWHKTTVEAKQATEAEIDTDGNGRVTKKEIVAKLKELGVEFDSRASKAELEEVLNEHLQD
jgi:hypothetical protein